MERYSDLLMEAGAYGYDSVGGCMYVCDSSAVPVWPQGATLSLQMHRAQGDRDGFYANNGLIWLVVPLNPQCN